MEIKNILSKINKTPEQPENFFAIEIGHEVVKTAIWHVKDKITQIVSVGSIEEWNKNNQDTLVEAIDASLSVASDDPTDEINKVIFGLPETWVGPDGIVDNKKTYLKTISKKLRLKPVGFVVTTEAIIHHLKIKEGGPPSVILISLTETEAIISIVSVGEIIGTQVVARSEDLSKDVEEGLARFSQEEGLPSRMLVYDGNVDLESAKQTLISYDWQSAASFLHFPKIKNLDPQSTIKAVAIAGGTEVAKSLGIKVTEPPIPDSSEQIPEELEHQDTENEINKETSAQEFGFEDPKLKDSTQIDSNQIQSGDNFEKVQQDEIKINQIQESETTTQEETQTPEPKSSKPKFKFKFPKIKKPQFLQKLKPKNIPFSPILLIGILSIILVFSAGFYAYWYLPKAQVTVYIKPKTIEKQIAFTLNKDADILNAEESIIPAQEESIELEGEKQTDTTGTSLVGERATGTVSIFNLTEYENTFKAGTSISFDDLEFTLDEQVTIASATAELGDDYKKTVTPTQESVKVTAADIGDQYNFSTGTELFVENYDKSSFVAKASTDFSGGFAREVQAVSSQDQQDLKEQLLEELKQQGINNLTVIASQEKNVVELEEEEIITEQYSADVGDQKDTLRLSLKFRLPIYTYYLKDLTMLIEQNYSQDIPDNFSIDSQKLDLEILDINETDSGSIEVSAKANLNLSPNLNPDDIVRNIRGKYPDATKNYFSDLPNFSRVETSFKFSLPDKLKTFPRKTENITVIIETEK